MGDRKITENSPGVESEGEEPMDAIRKFFAHKLHITSNDNEEITNEDGHVDKVMDDLSFDGLIKHWKEKGLKNVITMVGAGISTSAGIPDFRSPGSGLYDNLRKYNLPYPSAIFELNYFKDNPKPFFGLAKELYPGTFNPTPSHYFIRLLHEKGLLLRHYTQNIDTLERIAGIPPEKLVEAHGTFFSNHCCVCRKPFSMEWMKKQIFDDHIPTCDKCNGVVKPDIVFFGENLPETFYTLPPEDFKQCDLLIIMGTSLEVQPFASLVDYAEPGCVRLLINRTKVGHSSSMLNSWFSTGSNLLFESPKNTRDIAFIGDCDDGVWALADGLGWHNELKELIKRESKDISKEIKILEKNLNIEEITASAKVKTVLEKRDAEDNEKPTTSSQNKKQN